jgi:hypothetical protein
MANNLFITNAVAGAMADAFTTAADAGTAAVIEFRTGSQPADADSAVTGTLLGTVTFSATSFGGFSDAAPGALITANAITDDSSADATGTAGYWVMLTQTSGTVLAMGSIGTSGADINMNTLAFTSGSTISLTSFTMTHPES